MTAPRNKYAWLEGLWLLDLSGERLRVLGAIQSAHRDGASLISTAEIVKRTGLSRSAASRNLKAAERQKLVAVEWSRGGSRPHRITLLDPALADLNCGSMSAAVEEDGDCGSMAAAVTAASTRARVSDTLTEEVGGPLKGAPLPALATAFNVMDMGSPISPPSAPDGVVGEIVDPSEVAVDANGRMRSSVGPDAPSEADWIDEDEERTYSEKLEELRELVADLVRYKIRLPEALDNFLEADSDPDEDEIETLLDLANGVFDEENARVEAHNAEIDAARASVAARQATVPLSERINDLAARSAYVGKLSTSLETLPRELRLSAARIHSARIVAGLLATLPRHLAEAQAQALSDEVLTEVWRRDRAREAQAVEASTNVVSLAIMRSKRENADG